MVEEKEKEREPEETNNRWRRSSFTRAHVHALKPTLGGVSHVEMHFPHVLQDFLIALLTLTWAEPVLAVKKSMHNPSTGCLGGVPNLTFPIHVTGKKAEAIAKT